MHRRASTAVVAALVLALLACGIANAAPRLSGTFKGSGTTRYEKEVGSDAANNPIYEWRTAKALETIWRFKPTCKRGACDVRVESYRQGFNIKLNRHGKTYTGLGKVSTVCRDKLFRLTAKIVKAKGHGRKRKATRVAMTSRIYDSADRTGHRPQ